MQQGQIKYVLPKLADFWQSLRQDVPKGLRHYLPPSPIEVLALVGAVALVWAVVSLCKKYDTVVVVTTYGAIIAIFAIVFGWVHL